MKGIVKTDKFEMEYARFGEGKRDFVIIPGVSMKSIMPLADGVGAAFADFLEDYTVYLFDRKNGINSDYSIAEMAEDTVCAMKELGIHDADIFGASQGGMIELTIALNHPEMVHAMFLGSTMSRQNSVSSAVLKEWMELSQGSDPSALSKSVYTKIYSKEYYEQYRDIFAAMEPDLSPEEMLRFYHLIKVTMEFDVYDRLGEIKCPCFVSGSYQDRVLSGQGCVELAEKLACPIYMYDGYSHAVYDEAPDYRERMLRWFRSTY